MSDASTLSEELRSRIEQEIELLAKLKPGESITILGSSEALGAKRYALYTYFHVSGLKERFKISNPSKEMMVVLKKTVGPSTLSECRIYHTPADLGEWLLEHLDELAEAGEAEAKAFCQKHLPPTLVESAMELWKQKLGSAGGAS